MYALIIIISISSTLGLFLSLSRKTGSQQKGSNVVGGGVVSDLQKTKRKCKKPTTPGIPRRSPIQVLTRPDPAKLPRSDEIGRSQGGMAVRHHDSLMEPFYTSSEIRRDRACSGWYGRKPP